MVRAKARHLRNDFAQGFFRGTAPGDFLAFIGLEPDEVFKAGDGSDEKNSGGGYFFTLRETRCFSQSVNGRPIVCLWFHFR